MKHFQSAIVIAIMLALPAMGTARTDASDGKKSSPSYSRGFSTSSSGKSTSTSSTGSSSHRAASPATPSAKPSFGTFGTSGSAKDAAAPAPSSKPSSDSKPSFGSFGSGKSADTRSASDHKSTSALNKDLDKNAAKSNALKSLDARNEAKTPPSQAKAPSGMQLGGTPSNSQAAPTYPAQTAPPPVVYQNAGASNGGFLSGLVGFMLGRAMSGNHGSSYPSQGASSWPSSVNPEMAKAAGAPHEPAVAAESAGASVLRVFLWLLVLAAIGGALWFVWRRGQGSAKKSNYTL